MLLTLPEVFDLIGTIAFALSGSFVAVSKKMDIFGVNMLAVATACGGGLVRDLIIGNTPPVVFRDPFYAIIAIAVANTVFILIKQQRHLPKKMAHLYDRTVFWFDTIGLAAFTVDGLMVGVNAGYQENVFLIVFLGLTTGVGGGVLRDVFADQIPDIFRKHIYALASIAGGVVMAIILKLTDRQLPAMLLGFSMIILLRVLAEHFRWNLPRIT
jgi:uncharacterized membrane protein YeiH